MKGDLTKIKYGVCQALCSLNGFLENFCLNINLFLFLTEDDVPPQYEEVKSTVSISSTFKSDPMSTSFYGSLPESTTSDNATSVPIPITTTVTRTYVEYTSSPEISSVESAKKFTKYLDEADLDFEKTFQQQSPLVTTTSSQIIQSSSTITSSDIKESSSQSTVEKVESSSITKEEKLWDKPLGK